jgi:alpha-galactosidase
LTPNQQLTIGGVSSQPDLPFFNVEWPGEGVIAGVGWTAPWRADFIRDNNRSLNVTVAMTEWTAPRKAAAMRGARFFLRPGEHVRIPRLLLLFWHGDRVRAHNLWRRMLLDHYSPRPGGKLVQVPLGTATAWRSEAGNVETLDRLRKNGFPAEALMVDLGWQRSATEEESCEYLSDNVPNEKLFPNGMRALSDAAHERGLKLVLWFGGDETTRFEALYPILDRVRQYRPEWLSEEHPGRDNGNPTITRYMIDFYTRVIADWGIDVFRYDGRSTPPPDASDDRRGINWARSAEGFYEFWEALLQRFPNLWIDVCGGGGVNLDLETIRRSVVLWRCDFQCANHGDSSFARMPTATHTHTFAISPWLPLSCGSVRELSTYAFRSGYSPGLRYTFERLSEPGAPPEGTARDELFGQLGRKLTQEYLSVRHCFYGDFYPLSRYSLEEDVWMAWQFDRPDLGEGIVQAFRRSESVAETSRYPLRGLEPDATYDLADFDQPDRTHMTGRQLIEEGLAITINDRPGAAVIRYRKVS